MPDGSALSIRIQWVLTLLLAALAFWLGFTGFESYLIGKQGFEQADWADRVYYTLQLFVLDPAPFGTGPYGDRLNVARFLAPTTTVLALVQTLARLFGDWIRSSWFRRARGHVIVIGDGPAPTELAKRLVRGQSELPLWKRLFTGRNRVVLVGSGLPSEHARRHGMLIVPGRPTDAVTLRAAGVRVAGTVYAMTPVGATNAAVALAVRSMSGRRPIDVYARFPDNMLATALQARMRAVGADPSFRLSCFVLEDVAARVLLDQHPPEDAGGPRRSVVIAGFGTFPQAVIRELALRDRSVAGTREVTVVTANTGEAIAFGAAQRLGDAGITVTEAAELPMSAGSATVYVCYVDADAVVRAGFGQLRAGAGTVVLCLGRKEELGDALDGRRLFDNAGGRLAVFGILDAAFGEGRIRNDLVDRLARALHAHYLLKHPIDERVGGSRLPWEQLASGYRRDNQLAAEHIGAKLKHIGAVLMPAGPGLTPFAFRPREITELAAMEHERWRTVKQDDGVSHPALVPWGQLDPAHRDTNIEAVKALPDVLAEAGFQIVRDEPART